MNRLKFNEGGQPVYLDDLRLLQENGMAAVKTLLAALGDNVSVFWLVPPEFTKISLDDDTGYTIKIKGGSVAVDGEILEWDDTQVTVSDLSTPIWLCVKEADTDTRTFEDGQDRACATAKTVTFTTDNTGAEESYNIYEIKSMGELLKGVIGYTEYAWKNVTNITWRNSYSGTVKYQDRPECYRVWINIKSTSYTELTGSVSLFYADYTEYPWLFAFESDRRAFVQSENGVSSFLISAFEGEVAAIAGLPFDDVTNAASLPVKIIFDIPK